MAEGSIRFAVGKSRFWLLARGAAGVSRVYDIRGNIEEEAQDTRERRKRQKVHGGAGG